MLVSFVHGKAVTVDCSPARQVLGAATKKLNKLFGKLVASFQLLRV